jgi:hypothetical protein
VLPHADSHRSTIDAPCRQFMSSRIRGADRPGRRWSRSKHAGWQFGRLLQGRPARLQGNAPAARCGLGRPGLRTAAEIVHRTGAQAIRTLF